VQLLLFCRPWSGDVDLVEVFFISSPGSHSITKTIFQKYAGKKKMKKALATLVGTW
jgi:hypothetical protein